LSYYLIIVIVLTLATAIGGIAGGVIGTRAIRAFRSIRGLLELNRDILREVHRDILSAQQNLSASTMDIQAGLRLREFYARPVVREHIAALRVGATKASSYDTLSYPTSRATDLISPRFVDRGNASTVVCTIAIGNQYRDWVQPCLQSQMDYAARWGFAFCLLETTPEHIDRPQPAWMKIPLIAKMLLQGYGRILFIDADAMITNSDSDIDSLFSQLEDEQRSILLTEDEAGINCGVMFIRNTDAALRLFDLVWLNDTDINHPLFEQNALQILISLSNEVSSTVLVERDPKRFNSFPIERSLFFPSRPRQTWSHGDFVCHFSGIRTPHLERYIQDYAKSLSWNPVHLAIASPSAS
jgi:hypothetical protein